MGLIQSSSKEKSCKRMNLWNLDKSRLTGIHRKLHNRFYGSVLRKKTSLIVYIRHLISAHKAEILSVPSIMLICCLNISCSNDVKCQPQDIEFINNNIEDEITNLVELSLRDYTNKIEGNWDNITWKNKLGIGESESEISDKTWRSTGFYENFEQIINSNLDDAEVILNSEVDLSFRYNDDTEDLIEDINDSIYRIYKVKDPDFYSIYSLIIEEWVIFLIAFIIAFLLGGFAGGFAGGITLAFFIEVILYIVYVSFFMPDETQFVQQKIANSILEANTEIIAISKEISDEKLLKLCE